MNNRPLEPLIGYGKMYKDGKLLGETEYKISGSTEILRGETLTDSYEVEGLSRREGWLDNKTFPYGEELELELEGGDWLKIIITNPDNGSFVVSGSPYRKD